MRPRTRPAAQRGCKTITAAHLGHPLPLVMHEHELVARLEHLGAVGQHHHHAHQHGRRQCPARGCGLVRRRRAARAHPGRPAGAPCGPWRNCARARATVSPSAPVTPPPTLLASTCAARRATAQWPGSEGLYLDNQKELAQAVENCRGESACGARALSSAPQRRARAAEGIHKMWLHGGRSHFLVGCSSGVRARSGPRISGRYPGPICHDQFPGFVAATWLNN